MKKNKLYNIIFPVWFLVLVPQFWLIAIPGNFVIDSIVLLISLKIVSSLNIWKDYKSSIIKIWIFGFIADIIGALILILITILPINSKWYSDLVANISFNPFKDISSLIVVIACIIVSGILIYVFNKKISFKKLDLDDGKKRSVSIILAIFTAPYLFLYPTSLIYNTPNDNDQGSEYSEDLKDYIKSNKDTNIESEKAKTLFKDSLSLATVDFNYDSELKDISQIVVADEAEIVVNFKTDESLVNDQGYYKQYLAFIKQTAAIMFSSCDNLDTVSIVNSVVAADGSFQTKDVLIRKIDLEREYGINFDTVKNDTSELDKVLKDTENVNIYE